ncbi:MAG: PH domain-containing protein [Dermatophilaceae bacterium]
MDLPAPPVEHELMTLNPRWVAYAPLTTSGLLTALAVWGFVSQYLIDVLPAIEAAVGQVQTWGVWISIAVGVVLALAAIATLAITAYVLSFWGFRLSRHPGGTLHVVRGLLTKHATSLEEARIRGLEVGEPLGLRWAKAGRLHAIGTGLRSGEGSERGRAWLVPPAPRAVVEEVARLVLGQTEPVTLPLQQHGPAARRRRYVRAVIPAALLAALATWGWLRGDLPGFLTVTAYFPLLAAPLLARDRYAALGHALTEDYVIARSGSIERRRDVVARVGVVGVVTRASFFQRRAGVATVIAATAAGRQGYRILDVPADRAEALVTELVPQAWAFVDRATLVEAPDSAP